VEKSGISTAS